MAAAAKGGDGRTIFNDDNQPRTEPETKIGGVDSDALLGFIERIENLKAQQAEIGDDIKEVKAEAKGAGFDTGVINEMLKLRAMDPGKRQEREDMRDLYSLALGVFA